MSLQPRKVSHLCHCRGHCLLPPVLRDARSLPRVLIPIPPDQSSHPAELSIQTPFTSCLLLHFFPACPEAPASLQATSRKQSCVPRHDVEFLLCEALCQGVWEDRISQSLFVNASGPAIASRLPPWAPRVILAMPCCSGELQPPPSWLQPPSAGKGPWKTAPCPLSAPNFTLPQFVGGIPTPCTWLGDIMTAPVGICPVLSYCQMQEC